MCVGVCHRDDTKPRVKGPKSKVGQAGENENEGENEDEAEAEAEADREEEHDHTLTPCGPSTRQGRGLDSFLTAI